MSERLQLYVRKVASNLGSDTQYCLFKTFGIIQYNSKWLNYIIYCKINLEPNEP